MKKTVKWSLIFVILFLLAPSIQTAPVFAQSNDYEIASVAGVWTAVDGGSYTVSGVGTNEVRWGRGIAPNYTKSGLKFDGAGTQGFDEGDIFLLGTLTHMNWPVQTPTASGATLEITLSFTTPGVSPDPSFSFDFEIEETTNTDKLKDCPAFQQTSTPCDDRITFPSSFGTETFQIGDKSYTLEIIGFVNSFPGGTPVDSFITEERKDNSAYLVGKLSSVLVPEPDVMLTKKTNEINVESAPGPELVVGETVTWQYIVQNSGNTQLTGITVTDNKIGAITCPQTTLDPGELMTCTASGTVTPGQYTNMATVNASYSGGSKSDSDTSWYYGIAPEIALTKTPDKTTYSTAGELITYTFIAENTGNVTLTDVVISDPMSGLSALDCDLTAPVSLAPGAKLTCTATYTVSQEDVDSGKIDNTASVSAKDPSGGDVEDTDDATVNGPQADPEITLTKTPDKTSYAATGEMITYTFVAENTGNVSLTNVTITDPLSGLSALDCDLTGTVNLTPGDKLTCTATYTTDQGDIDTGKVENTATAKGKDPAGANVQDTDDATVNGPQADPEITLTKTPNKAVYSSADELITYTFIAENTGNVTLTNVQISDPMSGLSALDCDLTGTVNLAPGEKLTCTATYTTDQGDIDTGKVENTATAKGKDPAGADIQDTDNATVNGPQADPEITLTKTPDKSSFSTIGETITYTFVAENTGNVTLTNVTITDPLSGLSALDCDLTGTVSLVPGDKLTCTATYTTDQGDIDTGKVENTATAKGKDPAGANVQDTDDATVNGPQVDPEITLTKTPDKTSYAATGEMITYTFVAENTGNVTLTNVAITDPLSGLSALDCDLTGTVSLVPGDKLTCTATYTTDQGDIDTGKVENTATAKGKDPAGANVQDTDDATVNGPQADPEITLTKTPDKTSYAATGEMITYTFVAENTGNVTLTNVAITDPLSGLSALDCDLTGTVNLAPGEKLTCTATYTTDQGDIDTGKVENTATAKGKDPAGADIQDTDSATVNGPQTSASIELTKTPDKTSYAATGEMITYTFVAENTGNVTLTNVTITDPLSGLSALDCDLTGTVSLAPGDKLTCTATYTTDQGDIDTGKVENTATAKGKDPAGANVQDTDDATVNGPLADPEITLTKTPDKTSYAATGEMITYTFVAENTGNVTLTNVTITDPLSGLSALDCDLTGTVSLAPGDKLTCTATYTTDQGDIDTGKVENTATAKGKDPAGANVQDTDDVTVNGPQTSASIELTKAPDETTYSTIGEVITYTFIATNIGDVTLTNVTIADPMDGLSNLSCNLSAPVTLVPGAKLTCTATYTVDQGDIDAGEIENTAKATGQPISGDPVEDSDDVTITATDIDAEIELTKTANPETFTAIDEVIAYTFIAENTGDVTLTDVEITDPMSGLYDWNCDLADPVTLLPGEVLTCTANYKIGQADIDRGFIENTATATGDDPSQVEVSDDDDALIEGPKEEASIRLVKVANPLTFSEVGDEITYTLVAINNGIYTLFNVTIDDPMIDPSALDCEPEQPLTLLPGESITCTAKYLVTQADLNKGSIENSATATGTDSNEQEVSDEDDALVEGPKDDASIKLEKTANPSTYKKVGDEITYTFIVTNDGIYTLTDVVVTDDLFGLSFGPIETLDPGESETYKYTYTITQADIDAKEINNVATATGKDPEDNPVTTTDEETITGPEPQKIVVEPKELPTTGFAPNKLTVLPSQPAEKAYASYSDFWLEIPKLGVKVDIVGVPATDDGWDVTWLGNQAGWLYGTTFPTWPGNSTLTGHVWDSFDQAGPFVNLNQLVYGDQIIIHLYGSIYIFEVRSTHVVLPENLNVIDRTETYSWLNLITCKGFNEEREEYLYRLIVRAILVDVQ